MGLIYVLLMMMAGINIARGLDLLYAAFRLLSESDNRWYIVLSHSVICSFFGAMAINSYNNQSIEGILLIFLSIINVYYFVAFTMFYFSDPSEDSNWFDKIFLRSWLGD
jgi:hypothetical protein